MKFLPMPKIMYHKKNTKIWAGKRYKRVLAFGARAANARQLSQIDSNDLRGKEGLLLKSVTEIPVTVLNCVLRYCTLL